MKNIYGVLVLVIPLTFVNPVWALQTIVTRCDGVNMQQGLVQHAGEQMVAYRYVVFEKGKEKPVLTYYMRQGRVYDANAFDRVSLESPTTLKKVIKSLNSFLAGLGYHPWDGDIKSFCGR